eukprot:jgi/Tetstr1/462021/TSEL_007092.t1
MAGLPPDPDELRTCDHINLIAEGIRCSLARRRELRAALLRREDRSRLKCLGKWKNDLGGYAAFREFLELRGEGAVPGDNLRPVGTRESPETQDNRLAGEAGCEEGSESKPLASVAPAPLGSFSLQEMEVVCEESEMPISVVKFAPQRSDLLAVGDEAGQVRIMQVEPETAIMQILEHEAGVSDLDWSAGDASLLACCEDGSAVLWGTGTGEPGWGCLRTLQVPGSAICCRFHPLNPNFVLVGTALGTVVCLNASTGGTVGKYTLKTSSWEGVFAASMAVTESLALVGDSRGHLVLLDADLATSPSGPSLALITRTQPPTRERVPLLSVQVLPPTDVANESTVLTYQADGCACLWGVTTGPAVSGRAPRIVQKLKAMIMAPSPYTNAVFCPPSASTKATETIALGCLHPGVTIFNLAKLNPQQAPSAVMQLQGHLSPVVALSWSHNHRVLAAGDVEGSLIFWRNGR